MILREMSIEYRYDKLQLFCLLCYSLPTLPCLALHKLLCQEPGLFDDHRKSYGSKSTLAIIKALSFFFFCRFNVFTENAEKVGS